MKEKRNITLNMWKVLSDQSSIGFCVGYWHVQTIDTTYQFYINIKKSTKRKKDRWTINPQKDGRM